MAATEEGSHTLPDGTKLYTKTWKSLTQPPTALLIFIHGFSDHCNTYYTLFPHLATHGIQTHTFDQRGWGRSVRSPSDRGVTGPTSTVLDDITSFVRVHLPPANGTPLFLMGHSMGGAEVLQYAVLGPVEVRRQIRGYLVESPLVALHESSQPNKMTVVAGKLASKVVPKWHMVSKLEAKWVSRDESVVRKYEADELCHDTGTLEGLAGMLQRAEDLEKGTMLISENEGVECRLWVGHGSGDRITSYKASKRYVERLSLKDKEFKTYDGWYHKLHAEPEEDKITFANDVANWILARAGSTVDHSAVSIDVSVGPSVDARNDASTNEKSRL